MSLLYTASFKEFGSLVCLWHDVKLRKTQLEVRSLNPRPAGVWLVTRPAGGGGKAPPPWDLPNYCTDFQISNAIQ